MKKAIGLFIVCIFTTVFFYFYNQFMPKNIWYFVVALPIIFPATFLTLSKFGFNV